MQPIDEAYTEKSFDEGRRVANQIRETFGLDHAPVPRFAFQGSVTNDTHIKAYSDIDLLVIEQRFLYTEPPHTRPPYAGDAIAEFGEVRAHCADIVQEKFPAVLVDDTPGKAIKMTGGSNVSGSLARNVDVVIAAWWDTQKYMAEGDEAYRGVTIFDSATNRPIHNLPFVHNLRIDEKDIRVSGNLRKVIRLLKSIVANAEGSITVSSYDAVALAYGMEDATLNVGQGMELVLLEHTRVWLQRLCDDPKLRDGLMVPNQMRKVFESPGGATLEGLKALTKEVHELADEIKLGIVRRFRTLEEARLTLPTTMAKSLQRPKFDRSKLTF